MFIPLHDSNGLEHIRFQYVTVGLIVANVLIFIATVLGVNEAASTANVYGLGYIPAVMHDIVELAPADVFVPEDWTYITYAFLHADIFHLGGNMLFLWVFGDNVEDALGHVKFLIFYLACAVAGAWLHGVILPDSEAPLIGASGAIAGIVAAYLILHPKVKVWVLVLMRIPLRIPAWIPLALWVGFQFVMLGVQSDDQVSWPCHVGGIIAGSILVLFLRRKGVPLFDRELQPIVSGQAAASATVTAPAKWGRPD